MIVNGKEMNYDSILISQLLKELKLNPQVVVVEVNNEIISKEKYTQHLLNARDKVEIVAFIGGG